MLLAVGTGAFMSSLDGSVVNTTLPVIRQAFGANVAAIEWVVTVYLLTVSGLLLTFGRLGDLRGHKRTYLSGFGIFIAGSALSGIAPALPFLVGARVLQALGAAILFSNAPAIITASFPAAQRGQALGFFSTAIYLGLTAGPSLGGFLAGALGWRSVFYINLPIGVLAVVLGLRFIPRDHPATLGEQFDALGAAVFLLGLVSLLFGLNRGHDWGWSSARTIACLATAVLSLIVFLRIERRSPAPMLDLSLFASRTFSVASASAVLNYICLYGTTFLLPFYLIQGRGLGPAQAGLLLTAQPLVMAIAAPLSGTLSDRIGSRLLSPLGMGVLAAGLFTLSRLTATSPYGLVVAGLVLCGLGNGLFASPNTSALMGAAPRSRQGIASGVMATARNFGMVLGVGLAGAVFTSILAGSGNAQSSVFVATRVSFGITAAIAVMGAILASTRPSNAILSGA